MKRLKKLGAVILAAALTLSLFQTPVQAADVKPAAKQEITLLGGVGDSFPALKDHSLTLRVGESKKIGVKNCKGLKVTYKSADKSIATVSKKGKVKAKKEGRTHISVVAKTKKGELRGNWSCTIYVKPALASKKTMKETIEAGKQLPVNVTSTQKDAGLEITISTESEEDSLNLDIGVTANKSSYKTTRMGRITPDEKEMTVKIKASQKVVIYNEGDTSVDVTITIKTEDGEKTISNVTKL